jgi:hypothetical protein
LHFPQAAGCTESIEVEMEFSPRMVFIIVLLLMGLLVLFFNTLPPAASTGPVDGGGYPMYLPLIFR